MPIEAELKAVLRDPAHVRALLAERGDEQISIYRDTYYDRPDRELTRQDRELRVRVVESPHGRRCLLTYKDPAVDQASRSKPEYETHAEHPEALDAILTGLGFKHLVSLEKHCVNYAFTVQARHMEATLVTVPELDDTFLEIETHVHELDDLGAALDVIRATLDELDISLDDLTTQQYTQAVMARRP